MQRVRSYSLGHGNVNTPGWLSKHCSFCPPSVCPPLASLSLAHTPVCSLVMEWMPHGTEEGDLSRTLGGGSWRWAGKRPPWAQKCESVWGLWVGAPGLGAIWVHVGTRGGCVQEGELGSRPAQPQGWARPSSCRPRHHSRWTVHHL